MHNHINRNVRHYDKNHKKVWCLTTSQDLPFDQISKLHSSSPLTAESPKGEPEPHNQILTQDQILTKWSPSYDQNIDESTDQPRPILQDTNAQQSISDHDRYITESNNDDIDSIDSPTEECDHASYSSDSSDEWTSSSDSDDTFYQCEHSDPPEQTKTLSTNRDSECESSRSLQTSQNRQNLQSPHSLKNACIKMSLVALIVLIMVGYAGDSPHPSPPLNLASPTIANRTSTALVVLSPPPDRLPKCPIQFRILPYTFGNLLKILEFYHHVKVTARLREHNCGKHANATEVKHEAQQHLNVTHQTKGESLLAIPSRPRVYNYSVCSMEATPPTLTCYLWEAPTTSSARMCPAPDVTNSTNSKTVQVDPKPLGAIIATPRLPTYLLSYEWKLNTITSIPILPAPSSKPPTILSGQKPVKPPKTSPQVEIREQCNITDESASRGFESTSFFFWPWFYLIAICLLVVSLAEHCVRCYLHRGRTTITETQKQNKERRPHKKVQTEQLSFSDLITVSSVAKNSQAEVDEVNASEQVESNSSSSDEAGIIPHVGEPGSTTTEFLPLSCKVSGSASIDSNADMPTRGDEISNSGSSSNTDHSLREFSTKKQECSGREYCNGGGFTSSEDLPPSYWNDGGFTSSEDLPPSYRNDGGFTSSEDLPPSYWNDGGFTSSEHSSLKKDPLRHFPPCTKHQLPSRENSHYWKDKEMDGIDNNGGGSSQSSPGSGGQSGNGGSQHRENGCDNGEGGGGGATGGTGGREGGEGEGGGDRHGNDDESSDEVQTEDENQQDEKLRQNLTETNDSGIGPSQSASSIPGLPAPPPKLEDQVQNSETMPILSSLMTPVQPCDKPPDPKPPPHPPPSGTLNVETQPSHKTEPVHHRKERPHTEDSIQEWNREKDEQVCPNTHPIYQRGKPRPWNFSPLSTDRKLSSQPLPPVCPPSRTHPSNRRIFTLPYTRKKRVKNRHFRITRRVFLILTKDVPPARLQPKHPSLKKDPLRHFLPCTKHQLPSRENSHYWKDEEMDGVDNDGGGSSQSSPGSGGQSGNGGSQHRENGCDNGEGGGGGATGGTGGREGGEGEGGGDRHGKDDESSDEVQTEDKNQQDEKLRQNLTETNDSGIGPSQSASSIPGLPAPPPKLEDQVQNSETMPILSSLMTPVQPCDKPPDLKPPSHPPPSGTLNVETQPSHKTEPVRHRKERPHAEDSIQEWDREKDEQVCPNTHPIYQRGKPRPWNSSPLSTDRKLSSQPLPPVCPPSRTHPSDRRIFSLPYTRKKRVKNRHFRITRRVFLILTKDVPPARLQPKHPSLKKDPLRHFLPCTKHQLPSRENSHYWKDEEMDGVDNDGGGSSQSSPGSGGQSGNGGSQHRENGCDNGEGGGGGATGGTGGREGGEGEGGGDRHGKDDESSDEVQTEDKNQQDEKLRQNLTETNDSGFGLSQSASSIPGLPAPPPKLEDQVQNSETMPILSSLMTPVQPCDKPPDPKPPPHPPPSGTLNVETQPSHKTEPVHHRKERPHTEDSIQEWNREKDEQVCPNTHPIYQRGKPRPWNFSPLSTDRKLSSQPLPPVCPPSRTHPSDRRIFSLPYTRKKRVKNRHFRITRRVFLILTKDVPPARLQPKHPSLKKDPLRHFLPCTKHQLPSRENSHYWKDEEMDGVDNDGGGSSQSSPGSGGQSGNGGSQHRENGYDNGEGGGGGATGGTGGREGGEGEGGGDRHGKDDESSDEVQTEDKNQQDEKLRQNLTETNDSGIGPSQSASSIPGLPAPPPKLEDQVQNSETMPILSSLMTPVQPCDKPPDLKPPPHPPLSDTLNVETQPSHKTEPVRHRKERPHAEDSVQEWDREKDEQVCPNTYPRWPEKSEDCNKGPQHTLKPSLFLSNAIDPGGGSIVDGEFTNPPAKVSDEHGQQSTIVISVSGVIDNKSELGDGRLEGTEEESLEDAAIQTPPPKSPDIQETLVPETSKDLLSCSIYIKPRQSHLSLLPLGSGSCTVCVEKCLPTWVGKPVLEQETFQQELNEQLHGVQLSQEEKEESKGIGIESEEGRNKPACIDLPPRPVCLFYMRPPSRDYDPISLPDLRAFRSCTEATFLDLDTPSPQYMEAEMQNN